MITIFIIIFQKSNGSFVYGSEYVWPTPSYHQISSYFGYRDKPTANASTYHQGIDILASEGSGVLAMADGLVTFARVESVWRVYDSNQA